MAPMQNIDQTRGGKLGEERRGICIRVEIPSNNQVRARGLGIRGGGLNHFLGYLCKEIRKESIPWVHGVVAFIQYSALLGPDRACGRGVVGGAVAGDNNMSDRPSRPCRVIHDQRLRGSLPVEVLRQSQGPSAGAPIDMLFTRYRGIGKK